MLSVGPADNSTTVPGTPQPQAILQNLLDSVLGLTFALSPGLSFQFAQNSANQISVLESFPFFTFKVKKKKVVLWT